MNTTKFTLTQLNHIAALLRTTDKDIVYSAILKTLIEDGISVDAAVDAMFGDGAFKQFAGKVYDALRAK